MFAFKSNKQTNFRMKLVHNIVQNATKTYFVSDSKALELSLLAHHNSQTLQNERSVTQAKSTLLNFCTPNPTGGAAAAACRRQVAAGHCTLAGCWRKFVQTLCIDDLHQTELNWRGQSQCAGPSLEEGGLGENFSSLFNSFRSLVIN